MKPYFPILLIVSFLLSGCSNEKKQEAHTPFSEWEGVTLVDSLGVFQYKDTLYYFNEPSEFLFKIPYGFTALKGNYWDVDGIQLVNADSTMVIDLIALDRGLPKASTDATWEDILSMIACDNGDIRMFYEQTDTGYLKVGFTEEFKPLLEKAHANLMEDEDMYNYHIHIVRFTYPDSLAKQAFNLDWEYIKPWPNNIYK